MYINNNNNNNNNNKLVGDAVYLSTEPVTRTPVATVCIAVRVELHCTPVGPFTEQGCQSGAMALQTAPVKISWCQGLLLQRQTTLQQAIMNCLTALSGHAANARCSTVVPQRRHMHHGHTYHNITFHLPWVYRRWKEGEGQEYRSDLKLLCNDRPKMNIESEQQM